MDCTGITIRNATGRFFFLPTLALAIIMAGTKISSSSDRPIGETAPPYLWPTNASRTLSSTFAETREGHFHFGIDIRTNSGVGYPCYAVEEGDVVRIKVSPYGYGKVLYLQLIDGRMAVYAHLQRFAPRVEEIVKAQQYRLRSYRCHRFFEPGELHFDKGNIVAYSGSSGIGHPHLHFEIRDDNGYLNPHFFGFTVADSRAPRPQKIAVLPLSTDAEVDEDFRPKIYLLQAVNKHPNHYELIKTPSIYGPVGLGISGFDQADAAPNKVSFYGMDLYVDDSLRFSVRYDDIGFQETKQVELERDFRLQRRYGQIFHHLWRDPQVTADLYRAGDGILDSRDFSPGLHNFEIILRDFSGNSAHIGGRLNFQAEPFYQGIPKSLHYDDFFAARSVPAVSTQTVTPANNVLKADFYDDYAVLSLPSRESQEAVHLFLIQPYECRIPFANRKGKWFGKLPLEPFPAGPWTFEIQIEDQNGNVQVDTAEWIISPITLEGGTAASRDSLFRANFTRGSVYRTLYARVSAENSPDDEIFRSRIYRLDPFDMPIRGDVDVAITIPDNEQQADKLGIYYLSKKEKWSFVDNDRSRVPGTVSGSTPTLEKYALIKDTDPPELRWLSPRLATSERRPTFRLEVKDELSGVDDRSVTLEIDGRWLLMEYDPEVDRIFGQPEEPLTVGDHLIEVLVKDFSGNEASLQRTLKVVGQ